MRATAGVDGLGPIQNLEAAPAPPQRTALQFATRLCAALPTPTAGNRATLTVDQSGRPAANRRTVSASTGAVASGLDSAEESCRFAIEARRLGGCGSLLPAGHRTAAFRSYGPSTVWVPRGAGWPARSGHATVSHRIEFGSRLGAGAQRSGIGLHPAGETAGSHLAI